MAIYSWFTHKKWWFTILIMLVYQRVILLNKIKAQWAVCSPRSLVYQRPADRLQQENPLFQISMVVFAGACWKLMRVDYIAIVCGVVQTPSTHLAGVHHKGFPQCFFSGGFKEKQTDLPLGMIWIWFSCLPGVQKRGAKSSTICKLKKGNQWFGVPYFEETPIFQVIGESTKHSRLVWRILKGIWNKKPFCFWW